MKAMVYGENEESSTDHDNSEYDTNSDEVTESEPELNEELDKKEDKTDENKPRKKQKLNPPFQPKNLKELIQLAELCQTQSFRDTDGLEKALEPLKQLYSMIGQERLKQHITELVIQRLQKFNTELPHMLLVGPPGTSKSSILKLLGDILCAIKATTKSKVVFGQMPTDFVSNVLGDTAKKTRAMFEKARGGILAIDELHNLADNRHLFSSDCYSKSCGDTINSLLTPDANSDVLMVGCGYELELKRDFFTLNPGLASRFPTILHMDTYNAKELRLIFLKMIKDRGFHMEQDECVLQEWFEDKILFAGYGRSVQCFVDKCIRFLSLRTFGQEEKKTLLLSDVLSALEDLKRNLL